MLDGIPEDSLPFEPLVSTAAAEATAVTPPTLALPAAIDGITPVPQFEPIVNVPATVSFVIIAVVFALLQWRINAIGDAATSRVEALKDLKRKEAKLISGGGISDGADDAASDFSAAKGAFEAAMRKELNLRSVIPGVRIAAPNDPQKAEEERAAVKKYLGWEMDGSEEKPIENKAAKEASPKKGFSDLSLGVLAWTAAILIATLFTLSFDPMTADSIFTNLGGDPPADLPFSSWSSLKSGV